MIHYYNYRILGRESKRCIVVWLVRNLIWFYFKNGRISEWYLNTFGFKLCLVYFFTVGDIFTTKPYTYYWPMSDLFVKDSLPKFKSIERVNNINTVAIQLNISKINETLPPQPSSTLQSLESTSYSNNRNTVQRIYNEFKFNEKPSNEYIVYYTLGNLFVRPMGYLNGKF